MGDKDNVSVVLIDETALAAIMAEKEAEIELFVQRLRDAIKETAETLAEMFGAVRDALALIRDDIFSNFAERDEKRVRRDWPRPQNQRVRPLLMDRRRKTYHCRNAI